MIFPEVRVESLIGLYVLWDNGSYGLSWLQGRIVGQPVPGYFLVQLMGWEDWGPDRMFLATPEDMKKWDFYPDFSTWHDAAERVPARRRLSARPEHV